MSIYIVTGRPGSGKGQFVTQRALDAMRRGRVVAADHFIEGALPWIEFADCAVWTNTLFVSDETAAMFNSRDFKDLDPVVYTSLTQHRKGGNDLYLTTQHLASLEISMKRIAAGVVQMTRLGPDGGAVLRGAKPRLWRRPWCFVASWYYVDQFDDAWNLKPGSEPVDRNILAFSEARNRKYDTTDKVIPAHLAARFEELAATAPGRQALPPASRRRSMRDISLEAAQLLPALDKKEMRLSSRAPSTEDFLASRRFYRGDEPDPYPDPPPASVPASARVLLPSYARGDLAAL